MKTGLSDYSLYSVTHQEIAIEPINTPETISINAYKQHYEVDL